MLQHLQLNERKGEIITEERNARRIRQMESLAVLAKILSASHDFTDHLESSGRLLADLRPGTGQSMDWRCSKCRDDGCQGRVVV